MILVTGARGHIGNVSARLLHGGHTGLRLMVRSGSLAQIEARAASAGGNHAR